MEDYNLEQPKKKKFTSKYEKPPVQLEMPLKENWFNKMFILKKKVIRVEDRMRFSGFWRNFWVWLTIFVGTTATIVALFYVFKYWNLLPEELPVFQLFNTAKNKLVSRYVLVIISLIPLISTIGSLIFFYMLFRYFEKLKFLIFQIVLMISVFTIYGLFSIVKLY